jgi:hypothetical protein
MNFPEGRLSDFGGRFRWARSQRPRRRLPFAPWNHGVCSDLSIPHVATWLLRHLKPDFKTIADFRRDNRNAFRQVFREFVLLCRQLDLFAGPSR